MNISRIKLNRPTPKLGLRRNFKTVSTLSKDIIDGIPFNLSASSMVFEDALLENVQYLAGFLDHIEIILFQTPEFNNLPTDHELEKLAEIAERKKISYSVHMPASLEVAAEDNKKREDSIQSVFDIIKLMSPCRPRNYILHIPLTTPTLAFTPGCYYYKGDQDKFADWAFRALASLQIIQQLTGIDDGLLVENINYSPSLLEPFLKTNTCRLCLDLGHLMLGQENVMDMLKRYAQITPEIHLHGVKDNNEHQSLLIVPSQRVKRWIKYLDSIQYCGVINLEVFTLDDLETSLDILYSAFSR